MEDRAALTRSGDLVAGCPGAGVLVLRALADAYAAYARGGRGAWPTLGELGRRVALGGDAVRCVVEVLAQRGLLSVLPAPGRPVTLFLDNTTGDRDPRAIARVSAHLASHGSVFVAFPHPGSTRTDCAAAGPGWVAGWRERPGDVAAVLDQLAALDADAGRALRGAADPGRAGVLGHSQGGRTALVAAATDPRARAAVAVAPSVLHPDTLALVERLLTDLERGR